MQINRESSLKNTIKAYGDGELKIGEDLYNSSIYITEDAVSTTKLHQITEITPDSISEIISHKPEVIILGHANPHAELPIDTRIFLAKHNIGIECMDLGAACRTFNILLAEGRNVIGLFLL